MQTLTIIQPDDMHLHLRDGEALKAVAPFTARQMGRAVIMPNLKPPVVSVADALAYKQRILDALPEGSTFDTFTKLVAWSGQICTRSAFTCLLRI